MASDEKPCRACMDFRSWMKLQSKTKPTEEKKESESKSIPKFNIHAEDEYGGRGHRGKLQAGTSVKSTQINNNENEGPLWGLGAKYGCPADSVSLGKGSWTLLHSIAAYYPPKPTIKIQDDMRNFITLFSKFYPCAPCAEDFRVWIKDNPPEVSSKNSLSQWFCIAHNEVNRKLSKPEFDCSLVDQRWGEGWKDGSCD